MNERDESEPADPGAGFSFEPPADEGDRAHVEEPRDEPEAGAGEGPPSDAAAAKSAQKAGVVAIHDKLRSAEVNLKKILEKLGMLRQVSDTVNAVQRQVVTIEARIREPDEPEEAEEPDEVPPTPLNPWVAPSVAGFGVVVLVVAFLFGLKPKPAESLTEIQQTLKRIDESTTKPANAPKPLGTNDLEPLKADVEALKDSVEKLPKTIPAPKPATDSAAIKDLATKLQARHDELTQKLAALQTGVGQLKPTEAPADDKTVAAIRELKDELAKQAKLIEKIPTTQPKVPAPPTPVDLTPKFDALRDALLKDLPGKVAGALPKPPAVALPAEGRPLDIAVVFCQNKGFDVRKLWPAFAAGVRGAPDKGTRMGLFLGDGGELTTVRPVEEGPAADAAGKKLDLVQEPRGIENPGKLAAEIADLLKAPRRAVVIVVSPDAKVPDAWGEPGVSAIMVHPPGAALDGDLLARWAKFTGDKGGSFTLLSLGGATDDGYAVLNEKLGRQLAAAAGSFRR